MAFDIDPNYVDVAARIVEFRGKHPDGSLQPADLAKPWSLETIDGKQAFVVVAAAYRSPEDTRPGIGMAYEHVPGKTPYTRGSELQNAETAAWGRAIVAVLAADTKRGIASQEEVRNRKAEQNVPVMDWDAELVRSRNSVDMLRDLHQKATGMGAPQSVIDNITTAGLALNERKVSA